MVPSIKSIVHEHPLCLSSRFRNDKCNLCKEKGQFYGGYRCNEITCVGDGIWFHKECAESPLQINHPSHPQHLLKFIKACSEVKCSLCGTIWFDDCYGCSICNFYVDPTCARKSPPSLIIHDSKRHKHSLRFIRRNNYSISDFCEVCHQWIGSGTTYACVDCNVYIHVECVNLSPKVHHTSHPDHPLELFMSIWFLYDAEKTCILCDIKLDGVLYHCSDCNFNVCPSCVINPPPLSIQHTKTHIHQISLLPIKITFTCKACGMQGGKSPYLCIQCDFIVHRDCIDLPRVVNINKHDHRISLCYPLKRRYLKCRVCRKEVSPYYWAYSCMVCPYYVVHSQCAISHDVWDQIELEDLPEELEDIKPFIYAGYGENIIHFSHEKHILSFDEAILCDKSTRCEACILPVCYLPGFTCEECDFVLHDTCANLPRKIRHELDSTPFTLHATNMSFGKCFVCDACHFISSGFRYNSSHGLSLDVLCSSIDDSFHHASHLHRLFKIFFNDIDAKRCKACHKIIMSIGLGCDVCDFNLHFCCATLPELLNHRYDEHPLSLSYPRNINQQYWCDICENETDPNNWVYACSHCEAFFHVECVFGDFSRVMPMRVMELKDVGYKFEVIPNNYSSRPLCSGCESRGRVPFIAKILDQKTIYICSTDCLTQFSNKTIL